MKAVFNREIRSYFTTPSAYIFMGMFLAVSGFMFSVVNLINRSPSLDLILSKINFIFLFLIPILTMRLLSEERHSKTDQLLLTSPVSVSGIVLGKFFSAAVLFLLTLGITLLYLIVPAIHGQPAYAQILCSYIGFALMGLCFISIGLFISSLTENQTVAAIFTFATLMILYILDWLTTSLTSNFVLTIINFINVYARFDSFEIGVLSLEPIIYYISFTAVFLFLTIRSVEQRRWN